MPDYPMPPWLAPGKPWPPTVNGVDHGKRMEEIRDWRELFRGVHTRVFEEYYRRLQDGGSGDSKRDPATMVELLARLAAAEGKRTFEQEIDLPQALSLLWADLIASRPPRIGAGVLAATAGARAGDGQAAAEPGDDERAALERLTTDIVTEVHEAVLEQSYTGNGVFVARWSRDGGGGVVAYPADQWIPWSATGDPKNVTAHVIFRQEAEEAGDDPGTAGRPTILTVEIHYRGLIRYRRYKIVANQIAAELDPQPPGGAPADQDLPGVTEFLVQPFKNFGTAGDFTGVSDYRAVETLVAEMDVRSSQWGRLGDKFTAPTMHGPSSILELDQETGKWVFRTSPDGKYIPVEPEDNEPGYLIWDPQFEMQLQTWDRLLEIFYTVSGTTPAAFSNFKEGSGISGTALRLRMARPLQVAGRKRERLEPALRRALLAAQQLEASLGGARYRPTLPVFEWRDGLPRDPKEEAETEAARKRENLTSTKRALMRLDDLSEAEAEQQAEEIADEKAADLGAGGLFMPGAGQGLNGPGSGTEGQGGA